jgi:DNA-binding NarL/FixJ family response regulator
MERMSSLKILIVDDHRIFLRGLRLLLERDLPAGTEIVEAVGALSALDCATQFIPDLILLDIALHDGDGLDVSRQILARQPGTKLVILSQEDSLIHVKRALQAGVAGYLLKGNAPGELLRAIELVLAGNLYLCPELNTKLLREYCCPAISPAGHPNRALSAREREVLLLTAEGLRTKEIADKLNVGVKTAESYRRRLMRKLGYTCTAELVRYAIREGLISN